MAGMAEMELKDTGGAVAFTVEFTEQEIRDAVFGLIVRKAAETVEKHLFEDKWGNRDRKICEVAIKSAVRDMMKPHIDEIVERATDAAACQIERKGVKKLLDEKLK